MGKKKSKKYSDKFEKKDIPKNPVSSQVEKNKITVDNNNTMPKVFIPRDTANLIDAQKVENFALKFYKFAHFDGDKFSFYKTDKGKTIFNDLEGYPFSKINFNLLAKQLKDSANILFSKYNHVENLSIDWRLAIGLGAESVYETSINLHPVYGFPYIPGQAIKGIVRSWIIQEYFQNNEKLAFKNEVFCNLFGSPKESVTGESQGSLIFFDAYPIFAPQLKVDVMNPHYGPYYSEVKPPADYYNPIPIFFLTVENTVFQFIVAIKEKDNEIGRIDSVGGTYFDLGKHFMKEALTQKGIGAKTSVGYGYFK